MIKEAIEYIINLGQPKVLELDPAKTLRSTKPLYQITNTAIKPLLSYSLNSIIDFISAYHKPITAIESFLESEDMKKASDNINQNRYIINIVSYQEVHLLSYLVDKWNHRELHLKVSSDIEENYSPSNLTVEELLIYLKTHFVQSNKIEELTKIFGNLSSSNVKHVADDGFAQSVEVQKRINFNESTKVPPISKLEKIRTFIEIKQPSSMFLIRLKDGPSSIQCTVKETIYSEWKIEAVSRIKKYLSDELKEAGLLDKVSIIG